MSTTHSKLPIVSTGLQYSAHRVRVLVVVVLVVGSGLAAVSANHSRLQAQVYDIQPPP